MISYYLSKEELSDYLKMLEAGRESLNPQGKKMLDTLFFYKDEDGSPNYNWKRIVNNFHRNKRSVVCTLDDDVLPPALYPILDLMLGKALREDLIAMARNLADYPYTRGSYRRMLRSRDYHQHVDKIWSLVEDLIRQHIMEATVPQLLRGEYDVKRYGTSFVPPEQVAVWLDRGDEEVISILRDMLLGENNTNVLTYNVFRAIFKSRRADLVALVGRLLLAGKLQEGLRQAICETMDCGRQEHFAYMMGLIEANDLIRFSSVRRAIATTIGIGGEAADRVDKKQLALMLRVLLDPKEADELLASEDNVEAMVGIWYKGSLDLTEMRKAMEHIIESGRRHSVLLVSYYLHSVQDGMYTRRVAKRVLSEYIGDRALDADDMKMIACYLPFVLGRFYIGMEPETFREKFDAAEYFEDRSEGEAFFALCERAMGEMKRKEVEYRPCIFPWYGVRLTKEWLATGMVLAAVAAEGALTDRVAPFLPLLYQSGRAAAILLDNPASEVQERALVDMLRTGSQEARAIIEKRGLVPRYREEIAALLRLKTAGTRRTALELLYTQEDAPLFETVEALFSERDVNKRLGGLDLLLRCKADGRGRHSELVALARRIAAPTTDEQVLVDELAGGKGEDAREKELYDASYEPDFTVQIEYREKTGGMRAILGRLAGRKKEGAAGGFDASARCVRVVNEITMEEIFPRSDAELLALAEKLNALYTEYEDYEYRAYRYGREECTLAAGFYEMADRCSEGGNDGQIQCYPLPAVWEDFYRREIKDFATLWQLAILLDMPQKEDALFETVLERITGRGWTAFPAALLQKELSYFGEGYGGKKAGREVIRVLCETHA